MPLLKHGAANISDCELDIKAALLNTQAREEAGMLRKFSPAAGQPNVLIRVSPVAFD